MAGIAGSPIFAVIGGIALLLFLYDGISIAAIPVEAYRIVASPVLPTVPLFTLAGYILAEGGASRRFVRLFRATATSNNKENYCRNTTGERR